MIESESAARELIAAKYGSEVTGTLVRFVQMLAQENTRQNLVSKPSLERVWTRHILDSLQVLDYVPHETRSLLDIGSGAGFPGVVLAIARPKMHIHLVESRKRRIEWLHDVATRLNLKNSSIHGCRIEDSELTTVDVITARAVASLSDLLNLSRRFSTNDTVWVLPKGKGAAQELAALPTGIRAMFHVEQSITSDDAGLVVGRGKVSSPL